MVDDPTVADEIKAIMLRLRSALRDRGISLNEASERAGLGAQYVSKVSRGESNPTLIALVTVCQANGIELFEIVLDQKEADKVRGARSFQRGMPGPNGDDREKLADNLLSDWSSRWKSESNENE